MTRLSNTESHSEEYNYVHNKYNQEDYLKKLQGVDYFAEPKRPMGDWVPVSGCNCMTCENIRLTDMNYQTPMSPDGTPSKEAREVLRMERVYSAEELWEESGWTTSQLVTMTVVASVGYMAFSKKDQILSYAMSFLDSWQNAAR